MVAAGLLGRILQVGVRPAFEHPEREVQVLRGGAVAQRQALRAAIDPDSVLAQHQFVAVDSLVGAGVALSHQATLFELIV